MLHIVRQWVRFVGFETTTRGEKERKKEKNERCL